MTIPATPGDSYSGGWGGFALGMGTGFLLRIKKQTNHKIEEIQHSNRENMFLNYVRFLVLVFK